MFQISKIREMDKKKNSEYCFIVDVFEGSKTHKDAEISIDSADLKKICKSILQEEDKKVVEALNRISLLLKLYKML